MKKIRLTNLLPSEKGEKMTKFSDNTLTGVLPSATTPLALMLQNVTSSFTLITRDENPKALIICEKKIL